MPALVLPEGISVETNTPEFTFNPLGMVNKTGRIDLRSDASTKLVSRVEIKSLAGQVKTTFGVRENDLEDTTS
jgi:hypothetical protein